MTVKIKWKRGALRSIRYGDSAPKVRTTLEDWAQRIADNANGTDYRGYTTSSRPGAARPQGRWRTTVITSTAHAMQDNMSNNRLIRALYSTRPL